MSLIYYYCLPLVKVIDSFPLFISGMTVPGGINQEQSIEKQQNSLHRYRHEKRSNERQKFAGLYTGPYFDPAMPNNISVQLGDTALLICKVNQVGRKTVSQI